MNATWWRPLLTVALFSVLPFAVFVNDNRAYLDPGAILGPFVLALLAAGVLTVVAADRLGGPPARERSAVVFAAVAFLLFQFRFARSIAEIASDSDLVAFVVWLALFAVAVAVAIRISKNVLAWNYAVVAGALLLALPVGQYALFKLTAETPDQGGDAVQVNLASSAEAPPDVYFFLLDGYGRADQLERAISFDNAPFLEQLERRGFEVAERATAAYPVTFLSSASTLSMGYPAEPGGLDDYVDFFDSVGGDNQAVEAFRRLGYQFAFGSDYSSFECGERVDVCIEPSREGIEGFDGEKEAAILGATPLSTLLPALGMHFSSLDGYLTPEAVVEQVAERRSDDPLLAYFHLLTPHPPYRYLEGCELRQDLTDPGLDDWGIATETGGEEYARAARCVNRSLLPAIDAIKERDPNAIIVLQGDHGPKFGMEFHRPLSDWPRDQLDLRYSILNAQRLPPGCGLDEPGAQSSVNTFRTILGCITGEDVPLLPPRELMIDLEAAEVEEVDPPAGRP